MGVTAAGATAGAAILGAGATVYSATQMGKGPSMAPPPVVPPAANGGGAASRARAAAAGGAAGTSGVGPLAAAPATSTATLLGGTK
jgi:hypothetical protein